MPVVIGGEQLRIHADWAGVPWGRVERTSYRLFSEHLAAGLTVVDIGAHIGTYSLVASRKVGATGRVIAYEPGTEAREYLQQHLRWNDCRNTIVRPVGLGARHGRALYYCAPGEAAGGAGFLPVPGCEAQEIAVTTLDREVEALELTPAVVKLDVEGWELEVLRGGEATLRSFQPIVFLSVHPLALEQRASSEALVLEWLSRRGYQVEVVERDHETHVVARPAARARHSTT